MAAGSTSAVFSFADLTSVKRLKFSFGGNGIWDDSFISGQHIAIDNISISYDPISAPPVVIDTTPVPEPETYAMMLAGFGLMGFMVRRRKNEQA